MQLDTYVLFYGMNKISLKIAGIKYCLFNGNGENILFQSTYGVNNIILWLKNKLDFFPFFKFQSTEPEEI